MKKLMTAREGRELERISLIMQAIDGGTLVSVNQLAKMIPYSQDVIRTTCDKLVDEKALGKKVHSFWNGMHYATRNLYYIPEGE